MRHRFAPFAFAAALYGCAGSPEISPAAPAPAGATKSATSVDEAGSSLVHIQVLAFNDLHGNLEPPGGASGVVRAPADDPILRDHPDAGAVAAADGRTVSIPAGGVAYLAAHIRHLRASNPNTLVVSAGDLTGASPLVSNLFRDEPTVLAMNALGLDFEGVGNHDFDRGVTELERIAHGGCSLGDCDAGTFVGAHYEYLSANVRSAPPGADGGGATLFPAYGIRDVAGVRLAFVGVTLEATPTVTVPAAVAGLRFSNEAAEVNGLLPELARQRVDGVILLIHQGQHQQGGTYDSCEGLHGDLAPILAALRPEVDVVVSAHTHEAYDCVLDGRLVTSAGSYGRLITRIDLTWDPVARRFTDKRAKNLVVTRDVAPDPEVERIVEAYKERARPVTSRVIGYVKGAFARGNLAEDPRPGERRTCESPAGEIIADAQLAATRDPKAGHADVAFMNPGGVRTDLFARGGAASGYRVTYADAFEVQPFGNRLVTMTLNGQQLARLLDLQFEVGRLLQVSRGFTYRIAKDGEGGKPRVEKGSVRVAGKPLDPAKKYRITVTSFLADGGDKFSILREGTDRKEGVVDVDALAAFLGANSAPDRPLEPTGVGGRVGGDFCK